MWNPLRPRPRRLTLRQLVVALHQKMDTTMSALDDLKAAVARNDAGVAHVSDLLREVAGKLAANPDEISGDEIEEIANHLSSAADTLQGMTLTPSTTSGVAGATTANQAPADPPTPPTEATGVAS